MPFSKSLIVRSIFEVKNDLSSSASCRETDSVGFVLDWYFLNNSSEIYPCRGEPM